MANIAVTAANTMMMARWNHRMVDSSLMSMRSSPCIEYLTWRAWLRRHKDVSYVHPLCVRKIHMSKDIETVHLGLAKQFSGTETQRSDRGRSNLVTPT